jgi:hypothetical protein
MTTDPFAFFESTVSSNWWYLQALNKVAHCAPGCFDCINVGGSAFHCGNVRSFSRLYV